MKRYIYIIVAIVVIAVFAVIVIIFFKGNSGSSSLFGLNGLGGSLPQVGTQGSNGSGTEGGSAGGLGGSSSSTTANGGSGGTIVLGQGSPAQTFGIVSDGPILDYFVNASNTITAIEPDGTVIAISGGATTTLSTTTIGNIASAAFSYDGKKILASFVSSSIPQTELFDVASKTWTAAPQGMGSPQWSPSNYQIAYLSQSASGVTSLLVFDAASPKKAPVTEFSVQAADLALQWVGKTQFILSDKPTEENSGSVWFLDTSKGTLTPASYATAGAESIWKSFPTSTIGLLFIDNDPNNKTLELIGPTGAVEHSLSFMTLPSKCVLALVTGTTTSATSSAPAAAPYLFCGIPADQTAFTALQLPDSYNMMASFTSDRIVRVNVTTGEEDLLRDDAAPHIDATDLKVANDILFFINRYDQELYVLTLP